MKKLFWKVIALTLVIATLLSSLPIVALAESIFDGEKTEESNSKEEVYIKSVKLARAETKAEAKKILEEEGYIFLDGNLNEGTGQDGIWLGYQTTTDPTEAIYDMKLMNMKGGFTRTSMEKALEAQTSTIAEMAKDLEYLMEEFVEAYKANSVPAQKAYMALNFFRVVEGETQLAEENGLGYQIVHDGVPLSVLTEILMFCNPDIVDSIIKLLTMGIQIQNGNWMQQLSQKGVYDSDIVYMEDENELKRRADQLLEVLKIYSGAYNAMEKSGLIPDELDKDFNPVYPDGSLGKKNVIPAGDADLKKLDENRYKFYKIVADELAKYKYGNDGKTLLDFFCSLENEGNAKKLYPLVSVLTDGEFAALSYGCFLEIATGVTATEEDFDSYDEVYAVLTEEASSFYLYAGVDKALFDEDAVVGFTDTAQRHMASTGELEFFEKANSNEEIFETGIRVAKCIGAAGMAIMGITKITLGTVMLVGLVSSTVASSIKTGVLACAMKFCTMISGGYALLAVLAVVALWIIASYVWAVVDEWLNGQIDWDDNPMLEYLYDVKEVSFRQNSDDGISTEYMKRPVYALYEAVTDVNKNLVDLNARSKESSQWIQLFVSYDRQGDNAKPIKAEGLLVQTGNGVTPAGYTPLTRFGEVIAYDLNQWDEDDDVNGIYLFYQQDQDVAVDSGKTYYIYDVYLQVGESDAHCIELLEAAGYTPINVNLSPDLDDDDFLFRDKVYTYIGYKLTTNSASAIRDIRMVYGPSQGEIRYGSTTYAECGSNGSVTLYATKYEIAGTPLLAGGLVCFNDKADAPAGYEPVCTMAGGPAVSFNTNADQVSFSDSVQTFLYFLPERTFTSGTQYIGDIAFFSPGNSLANIQDSLVVSLGDVSETVAEYWSSYTKIAGVSKYSDVVAYYMTYNPYRAVYGVKAAERDDLSGTFVFENQGYVSWNRISWGYVIDLGFTVDMFNFEDLEVINALNRSTLYQQPSANMNGAIYLMGNPDSKNTYDASGEKMKKVQPLTPADIICWAYDGKGSNVSVADAVVPDTYAPVTNVFANTSDALRLKHERSELGFDFYINQSTEERPYVSNIYAIDELTLFRAYGGYDAGLSFDSITETMMLSQLASQGATNFNSFKASLLQTDVWDSGVLDSYDEINAIKFGYKRISAKDKNAKPLRDIFLYFNGFSTDEPPKELYRGNIKYTLLCEIPYNLTGYDNAPKPGVYLYGTTDSKAGDKIVDFEVSGTPFLNGYETIRTMNGRSLFAEIQDYSRFHQLKNPMSWAQSMYEIIFKFFEHEEDGKLQNGYFYLHIKREGDDLRTQEPYIGELYVASYEEHKSSALDILFDQGADGYVDVDLNADAGGDFVYVGYSYTANPDDAIKEIRAYHKKNPPATMTDDDGRRFTLVSDVDLNKDAGGNYIYLYTTKASTTDDPIASISVAFKVQTGKETQTWVNGKTVTATTLCTKRWDSSSNSDLNKGAGGEYVYLMYTTVDSTFVGTYDAPNYGKDKTYTRYEYESQSATGKYIGGLYVMDKNTILQEKIAAGTLPAGSTCAKISDQDVKDRLKEMGATTVLDTPILVNSGGYFKNNQNKVFIGYSRTDDKDEAIRNIAIKTEILSLSEPKEKLTINNKAYKLVAEAAYEVKELPHAINLIGLENGQDLLLPRFYLYYSTASGSDPICDICIDDLPILNGWNTVRSANLVDPFADVRDQAYEQYELANKDDGDFYDSEIVYTDSLFEWMEDVADLFDPEDADAKPFYIHVKRYTEKTIEEIKPYIGELFVANGDSKHEALSKLVAFEPDGYIDSDLNEGAGGDYVFVAYKRVAKETNALTDIMVYQGEKFEPSRRLTINEKTVKYTLVADVDLNSDSGGEYLYLYTTDSKYTGNPITGINVAGKITSSVKCGVEQVTVRRADGRKFTDEYVDLNKDAGGDYLYMVMTRTTTEGHRSDGNVIDSHGAFATCIDDGYQSVTTTCLDCGAKLESITQVYKADGVHRDADGDGNHNCDFCKKKDITEHKAGEPQVKDRIEATADTDGSYKVVFYCVDCGKQMEEIACVIPAGSSTEDEYTMLASLFGDGSAFVICSFAGLACLAAIIVYWKKKKTVKKVNEEDEI